VRFLGSGRLRIVLVVVISGLAGAGIAWADIPDSGVIHGCYKTIGGSLRVIDSSAGGKCLSSETALDWNQEGPTGATGTTGPTGPAGTARAWAIVEPDGTIDHQVNVSSVVQFAKAGDYCVYLNGIDATTVAAVVTVTGPFISHDVAETLPGVCTGNSGVFVHIWNTDTDLNENSGFSIVIP